MVSMKKLDKPNSKLYFESVSIISLEQGLIEVKSVNGNNDIGGEDFLERLFNCCFLEFKKKLV